MAQEPARPFSSIKRGRKRGRRRDKGDGGRRRIQTSANDCILCPYHCPPASTFLRGSVWPGAASFVAAGLGAGGHGRPTAAAAVLGLLSQVRPCCWGQIPDEIHPSPCPWNELSMMGLRKRVLPAVTHTAAALFLSRRRCLFLKRRRDRDTQREREQRDGQPNVLFSLCSRRLLQARLQLPRYARQASADLASSFPQAWLFCGQAAHHPASILARASSPRSARECPPPPRRLCRAPLRPSRSVAAVCMPALHRPTPRAARLRALQCSCVPLFTWSLARLQSVQCFSLRLPGHWPPRRPCAPSPRHFRP